MNKVIQYLSNRYSRDLSNTKVFFIALEGRAGYYDTYNKEVYINTNNNGLTKELTLVHELTHRIIDLNNWEMPIEKEEKYCKFVTIQYVRHMFGEDAVELVKDLV